MRFVRLSELKCVANFNGNRIFVVLSISFLARIVRFGTKQDSSFLSEKFNSHESCTYEEEDQECQLYLELIFN